MKRNHKRHLTAVLTALLLANSATAALADVPDGPRGPGDPLFQNTISGGQTENQNQEPEQPIGPGGPGSFIDQSGSEGQTGGSGDSQQTTENGDMSQEGYNDLLAEQQAAQQQAAQNSVLTVPHRYPRLQTTVLLPTMLNYSAPAMEGQTVDTGSQPFFNVSTFLENIHGNVLYRVYTSKGWGQWVMNGEQTPTAEPYVPVEAIQYRLAGIVGDQYDIYYMATLSNGQTTSWGKNGQTVGAMGQGVTMTGFQLKVAPKGSNPGLDTRQPLFAAHQDGIQYIDGAMRYITGTGENFTGWGWLGNDRYYFADSYPVTGWQYVDGYKYYFGDDGKLWQDVEPLIGTAGPFRIKINKQENCLTVYAQDGANGFIIPVKSFLTSCGDDTPLGTFQTPAKYRWHLMINNVYTQYATRLGSGLRILMHSIIYDAPNPYTVWASTYNNLGIARSAGCIRLTTADSKWIYDNCAIGTTVEVYNSLLPGPFERPAIPFEIPFEQTWDPTDPDVTSEGIANATASILAAAGQQ